MMYSLFALLTASAAAPAPDEIIVTGEWFGSPDIEAKQAADGVIDLIGQRAIAAQPSTELANALGRIPGVAVSTEGGEGRFVQLRGLRPALNLVTVDGIPVAAAESLGGGRQAPLDLYSTRSLQQLEVIKTPTPDQDGQGIGGILNIVTASPLDENTPTGTSGRLTSRAGTGDTANKLATEAAGMINFTSASRQWGLLATLSADSAEVERGAFVQDQWGRYGVDLPDRVRHEKELHAEDRLGGTLALAFAPTPSHRLEFNLSSALAEERNDYLRYEEIFYDQVEIGPDGGTLTGGPRGRAQDTKLDRQHSRARLSGAHLLGGIDLSWRLHWSEVTLDQDFLRWDVEDAAIIGPLDYTLTDNSYVRVQRDMSSYEAINFLGWARRTEVLAIDQTDLSAAADLEWSAHPQLNLKGGFSFRQSDRQSDSTNDYYGTGPVPADTMIIMESTPLGRVPLLSFDLAQLEAAAEETTGALSYDALSSLIDSTYEDYEMVEEVGAGYAMGRWTQGKLTLIGGIRLERTEREGRGNVLSVAGILPNTTETDETVALPMTALTYRPTSDWVLRAAIGRRLARPDFEYVAPRAGLEADGSTLFLQVSNPDLKDRLSTNYDLSVSFYPGEGQVFGVALFRKEIEDEILERTFLVTGPEILDRLADAGLPANPAYSLFDQLYVGTAENLENYTVDGIELFMTGKLHGLPAPLDRLHLSSSMTIVDETGDLLREGRVDQVSVPEQTDFAASISLGYEDEWGTAWIGYQYNGGYLINLGNGPDDDNWQVDTGVLDARLSVKLSPKLKLTLDGQNLTDATNKTYQGTDDWRITRAEKFGRSVFVGLSYDWR